MEIIAHRGIHDLVTRENTYNSIASVKTSQADGIEIDVRITNDDVCVIHHDTKLFDGTRLSRRSYQELVQSDPELLTVPQAIEILRDYGGLINFEIKHLFGERDRNRGIVAINRLAEEMLPVVRDTDRSRYLISSFSLPNIKHVRTCLGQFPYAYNLPDLSNLSRGLQRAKRLECTAIHVSVEQMKRRKFAQFVSLAHSLNIKVRVFTVNSFEDLDQATKYEVDGIFTDKVEEMVSKFRG